MIISITGGCGFIGKRLVKAHITRGDELRVLSRRKIMGTQNDIHYFRADLSTNNGDLHGFVEGVDILYHCAAELYDEELMETLHVRGTRHLLDAAKGNVKRWVQLSSVGAYGVYRNGVVNEATSENPTGVYEKTKTEADILLRKSGLPYVILRPSNVFALTMNNQSLFKLVKMIQNGLFFYIGRAGATANYVHVEDVVDALVVCGYNNKALGNTYNLSQNIEIEQMVNSILTGLKIFRVVPRFPEILVKRLVRIFGKLPKFPLTVSRINALTGHCHYDSTKIINELGFEFHLSLESRFVEFASKVS